MCVCVCVCVHMRRHTYTQNCGVKDRSIALEGHLQRESETFSQLRKARLLFPTLNSLQCQQNFLPKNLTQQESVTNYY